jgi:hypothetical protein
MSISCCGFMSKSSGLGLGGVLIGFGIGWIAIRYLGASWNVVPYLLILAGVGVIFSSMVFRQRNNQMSELTGGVIGGVIIAVVFSSVFGFSNLFPFGGGITGSGNIISREFDYTDFSVVDAGYGFNVKIVQDEDYSIVVSFDDNVLEYLEVSVSGDTLTVGLEPGSYRLLSLDVVISMPSLDGLMLSGGSNGDVSGFSSLQGISLGLSGGSEVIIVGSASDLVVDASGGSRVYLSEFICGDAEINFSGGSNGSIYVTGTLDVNLSGGSHLTYYGNPELEDISTSGGSTIKEG